METDLYKKTVQRKTGGPKEQSQHSKNMAEHERRHNETMKYATNGFPKK